MTSHFEVLYFYKQAASAFLIQYTLRGGTIDLKVAGQPSLFTHSGLHNYYKHNHSM